MRSDGTAPSQWEIHAMLIPSNYLFIQFKHLEDGNITFLRNVGIFNPYEAKELKSRQSVQIKCL
jgi:hypothetical protein